jgi:CBS domain-containing protein
LRGPDVSLGWHPGEETMETAQDIMNREVVALDPQMPLDEMERALRTAGISGAPVEKDGQLIGIISRSDVARQLSVEGAYLEHAMESYADAESVGGELSSIAEQLGKRLAAMTVEDAMIREVETISKTASLKTVAKKMLSSRHRRLIVVDENGKIAGIVTATDLVRVIAERG